MERPLAFHQRDRAFGLADRHRARLPGDRRREQVRPREHRLALGQVRHGPGHGLAGGVRRRLPPVPSLAGEGDLMLAGFPLHIPVGRPGHALGGQRTRVEPEVRRLLLPDRPERALVHVTLRGPGHQRRPLGKALVGRRIAEPRSAMAASMAARRVENASITRLGTPAISKRPSAWVFSIP